MNCQLVSQFGLMLAVNCLHEHVLCYCVFNLLFTLLLSCLHINYHDNEFYITTDKGDLIIKCLSVYKQMNASLEWQRSN